MTRPQTFFDKVWSDHVVAELGNDTFLIHIDRHILHELSGAMTLSALEKAGRTVAHPELTYGVLDHVLDTFPGRDDTTIMPRGTEFIRSFRAGCARFGIPLFDLEDPRQGIVHVVSPELGIALPGSTLICGDSHTCTVGGIGALAWGIGSSDGEHALVTQTLVQTRPRTMRVTFTGRLGPGVYPKDIILHLIGQISADGGSGFAIEFAGPVIRSMSIEGRLTICNMAVELSARTGMVAPDETTYAYLHDRPYAPRGPAWEAAVAYWRTLPSAPDAVFDKEVVVDCDRVVPQVTWGTSPEHVVGIDGVVPDPATAASSRARALMEKALAYSKLTPGTRLEGLKIDAAFIGSCTNGRLSDLRAAADILEGRKVKDGVRAICTPGSVAVKRQAEAEGIARIFRDAGFEWREPGCSLCMSAGSGGENYGRISRVISSTNRNFEGRQGAGVSAHLASPATVALSAVRGCISDVRKELS